jgi:NADP-dependent 3-hydroxy acid dehydrogenase YdfG
MSTSSSAQSTDVNDRMQVINLVDSAVRTYGRIDVLINNAGVMLLSALESLKVDEWDRVIDVNIKGVLYGIAAALPHMKAQKSGHMITTASVAGHLIFPASAVYSGTKFAVRAIKRQQGFRRPYWHRARSVREHGGVCDRPAKRCR